MLEPKLLLLISVLISQCQAIAQCPIFDDYGCKGGAFCETQNKKADCTCAQCTCPGEPCLSGPTCKTRKALPIFLVSIASLFYRWPYHHPTASVVWVPQVGLAVTAVQRMIPAPPSPVLMTASAFLQRTNHTPIVSVQGVTRPQIALSKTDASSHRVRRTEALALRRRIQALDSCLWLNARHLVTDITPVSTLDECKHLCVAMAECAACSFSKSYTCALLGPDTNRRLSSCFAPAVLYERDPTCG
ncbi:hypothetical protein PRIPAC_80122 [Pristionchus pacificus]|uniref:Uncharacterized protein n=1 Tax=Pristionchus pacificus TaxID=54126 RepID=A0A2A6BVI6_PRIPA|nr:hypothetical protein PRIPAC_80122 [Pristionchus pacificus]|eukprot:PDM69919.1 hypothetical protein PRIPAC_49131 [Pristionchus pacificus]